MRKKLDPEVKDQLKGHMDMQNDAFLVATGIASVRMCVEGKLVNVKLACLGQGDQIILVPTPTALRELSESMIEMADEWEKGEGRWGSPYKNTNSSSNESKKSNDEPTEPKEPSSGS